VVKVKFTPVILVPAKPVRGWGREGFGARRAGRGGGRTCRHGFAWHRVDHGGGRTNKGQWDHDNAADLGCREMLKEVKTLDLSCIISLFRMMRLLWWNR
jgi:hypothetical protein